MQKRVRTIRKIKIYPADCTYCRSKSRPDYKEVTLLEKYVTERGKIIGRGRTGLCSKHQRHVATAIKRARHVALMPFVIRA